MTAALVPTTDLGTDVTLSTALGASWGLSRDQENLSNAIFRRLTCPKGGLIYAPDYGIDVRSYLNASMTPVQLARMRSAIVAEVEREVRVQSCAATLTPQTTPTTGTQIIVALSLQTAAGPFDLVFAVSELSVERLGRTLTPAVPAEPTTTGAIVAGPPGPQGPPGPSGGGGGGSGAIVIDQSAQMAVVDTTERVVYEALVDFGTLGSTVTIEFLAQIGVVSGTGTFRLRIGGTTDTADGTVTGTPRTTTSSGPSPTTGTVTISNPTGVQLVKVTAQNSVLGQAATIRDIVVSFA